MRRDVLSLCSGYGGIELGLALAGVDVDLMAYAEFDKYASKVMAAHHPGVPNLGDIKAIDWASLSSPDILTAGYPCQPFSQAGKRLGTDDPRHLWPYVAEAIRHLRPRHVLLENVRGHVTKGLKEVIADLASLGYVGSWRCVRASDVGACHRRERVFIVASAVGVARNPNGERLEGRGALPERAGQRPVGASGVGVRAAGVAADASGPRVGQHAGGTPPQEARPHGDHVIGRVGEGRPAADAACVGCERDRGTRERWCGSPHHRQPSSSANWGKFAPAIARWELVLGRPAPSPTEGDKHRLNPVFVEWMMGLPEGHVTGVEGISRTQQLKILGNGVVPQQAALAIQMLGGDLTQPQPLDPT